MRRAIQCLVRFRVNRYKCFIQPRISVQFTTLLLRISSVGLLLPKLISVCREEIVLDQNTEFVRVPHAAVIDMFWIFFRRRQLKKNNFVILKGKLLIFFLNSHFCEKQGVSKMSQNRKSWDRFREWTVCDRYTGL